MRGWGGGGMGVRVRSGVVWDMMGPVAWEVTGGDKHKRLGGLSWDGGRHWEGTHKEVNQAQAKQ